MAVDAGSVSVRVGADLDEAAFRRFEREVEKAERKAKASKIEAKLGGDFQKGSFAEYERALDRVQAKTRRRDAFKAELGGDYDGRAFNQFERALAKAERDSMRTARSVDGLDRSFGRLGKGVRSLIPELNFATRVPVYRIAAIGTAIASIIPPVLALGGALGPVTGLLGALPGLGVAAGAGLGTAMLGLRGVGGALGEVWGRQTEMAAGTLDSAKKTTAAVDQVRGAESRLRDAQRGVTEAQEDLNEARDEAARRLVDMRMEANRANFEEREGVYALRDARQELARLEGDPAAEAREIRDARMDVRSAELDLNQTRVDGRRAIRDYQEAERSGVRGMDEVVQARSALADAQRDVKEASREAGQASKEAGQAMDEASAGSDALAESMAELSPAGRAFVALISERMFPAFRRLQSIAQQGLLPGLGQGMVAAMRNFPVIERSVGRISRILGGTALNFGQALGTREAGRDLTQILGQSERLLARSGRSAINYGSALRHITVAAEPLVTWLGRTNERLSENFDAWARSGRESGKLSEFFTRTARRTQMTVEALWDFGRALVNIGSVGSRVWGGDMLRGINDAAEALRRWTESVRGQRELEGYFTRWRRRWRDIADGVGEVVNRYRELRREGKGPMDAWIETLAEAFSRALPKIANNVARQVPHIVEAFVRGFLAADAWGRLFVSGWLLAKFGGVGAFAAIGRRGAAAFSGSFATAGAAGAARGFRGGFLARVGRLAPGIGTAIAVLLGPEIGKAMAKAARHTDVPGGTGESLLSRLGIGDRDDKTKNYTEDFRILERGARRGSLSLAALNKEFELYNRTQLTGQQRGELRQVAKDTGFVRNAFSSMRNGAVTTVEQMENVTAKNMRLIRRSMNVNSDEGSKAVRQNFTLGLRVIRRSMRDGNTSTADAMRSIRRLMRVHSGAGKDALKGNLSDAREFIAKTMRRGGEITERGMKIIRQMMVKELKLYGLSPRKALNIAKSGDGGYGDPDANKGREGGAQNAMAGGGLVGRWGEKGRDAVHAVLGRGEAVLNHAQQKIVNAGLSRLGVKGLPDLFRRTRGSKHYMAEGGLAGDGVSIADYMPRFAGGGIVAVPGFPGESAHRSILDEIAFTTRNFGVVLTDAYGPGHASAGHTVYGTSADFGGSDSGMDKTAAYWAKKGYEVGYDGRFGTQAWPGHGPSYVAGGNAHVHVTFGGSTGVARGGAGTGTGAVGRPVAELKRIKIGGPDSPLKSMVQRALDATRAGAQHNLEEAAGTTASGEVVQGDGDVERVFAKVARRLSRSRVATKALGMAGYAESGMRDLPGGDNTSQGSLQLLASTAAGTGLDPHNEGQVASHFLNHGYYGKGGANSLAAQGLPAHMVAQSVQGSAFSDGSNYAAQAGAAEGWMRRFGLASGGFAGGPSIADLPSAGGFAGGGFVDRAGLMTGKGSKLRGRSFKGISQIEGEIEGLGRDYELSSRRFDLTDEEFVIEGDENTPPSLDQAAIAQRVGELDKLISIRQSIATKYKSMVDYINRLVRVYETMQKRLRASAEQASKRLKGLKGKKGKEAGRSRKAAQGRLDEYRGTLSGVGERLADLRPKLSDAKYERESSLIDLSELRMERTPLLGGGRGLALPEWSPPDVESGDESFDGGDGGARPPSATEIAEAAHQQLETLTSARADLFKGFGSNFTAPGGASGALASMAGYRAFGGATAFGGGGALDGGSQKSMVQHNYFPTPPPDPHAWIHKTRFEMEKM